MNMQQMMKQAQKMQKELAKAQEERLSPVMWYIAGLRISLIRLLCIGGCI